MRQDHPAGRGVRAGRQPWRLRGRRDAVHPRRAVRARTAADVPGPFVRPVERLAAVPATPSGAAVTIPRRRALGRVSPASGAAASTTRAGRSLHEVGERAADRLGDADQGVELRRGVALLDPAVRRDVDAASAADVVLRHVAVLADVADLVAHLPASGDDPVVGWGGTWHASTLPTP